MKWVQTLYITLKAILVGLAVYFVIDIFRDKKDKNDITNTLLKKIDDKIKKRKVKYIIIKKEKKKIDKKINNMSDTELDDYIRKHI